MAPKQRFAASCPPRRLAALFASLLVLLLFAFTGSLRLFLRPARRPAPANLPGTVGSSTAAAISAASTAAPAAATAEAAAIADAHTDHLLAAISALLPRGADADVMAVERFLDVLLHSGSLASTAGPPYRAPPAALRRPVRVVQVGANTGDSDNDPLYHRLNASRLSGGTIDAVLVEPVPHLFTRLQATYARYPEVLPVWGAACAASSPPGSTAPFYAFVANASQYTYFHQRQQKTITYPEAVQQLGSFSKRFLLHVTAASEEDLDRVTVVHNVPCVSLGSIMCDKEWGESVDYFHIDAEGADDLVLYAAEVALTRPRVVRLEAQHIDGDSAVKHLEDAG